MPINSFVRAIALLSIAGAIGLSGCAGIGTIPDTNMPDEQISPAPVQGKVLGGHAPIVGAHVYVLQPGTSGIGSQASSLLTAGYNAGGYTISTGSSDPSVKSSWNYVTTDATGQFNITGAYTCVANQPVYLYAYGGTPSTTNETFPITQVVVTNPTSGTSLLTFTTSGTELLSAGEKVYPTGFTGTLASFLNGTLQIVDTPANSPGAVLTTTQFSISLPSVVTAGTYTTSSIGASAIVTGSPQFNSGLVQLAVLGNCPSKAPFTFGPGSTDQLTYVYMNEVSTVAMAYAFQGFTKPSLNNATQIGSSGTAQGLVGIENAALTAAELYDITGNAANISSAYDGEGHLANTVTSNGNGIVPQAVLDTLGNILAACVDSAPNVTGTSGSDPTVQCSTLFNTATNDGTTTGTPAVDTATAAINIARHPAGVGNSSFMSTLYGLPSGAVPFVPNLTAQPNDFTVGIQYTASRNSGIDNAESVAIDGNGYVWITTQNNVSGGNNGLFYWNSQGVTPVKAAQNGFPLNSNSYTYGYVSIDPANNAWTGDSQGSNVIVKYADLTGAPTNSTSQYGNAYAIVTNYVSGNLGNVFVFAQPPSGTSCALSYCLNVLTPTGTVSSGSPYEVDTTPFGIGGGTFGSNNISHASLAGDNNIWVTSEGNGEIDFISQTGARASVFTPIQTGNQPELPAVDANSNAIVPIQNISDIDAVSTNGNVVTLTSANTGALLFQPFGSAVDGNGNIWITNRCNGTVHYNGVNYPTCNPISATGGNTSSIVRSNGSSSLVELTPSYTLGGITSAKAVSPATNYNPENESTATSGSSSTTTIYPLLFDPLNLAIDPSGNIWVTNYGNGGQLTGGNATGWVTEIIGLAAPVVTPLSTAAGLGKFGATP